MNITVGISNKHAHLTQGQVDCLFGKGYELTFFRKIKQPDEFVSGEKINIIGPKGILKDVRILGPVREKAQIEMTLTNARNIGIEAEIRISHHVSGSSGIRLQGPKGTYELKEGVIAAMRHLHMTPEEAETLQLKENQRVCIETTGSRGVIFKNVVVRIDPLFSLELHLDTDEANAASLKNGDSVQLLP
ncbi:MAG: phosphate propanoyltransferase [Anaerovorax sp.]